MLILASVSGTNCLLKYTRFMAPPYAVSRTFVRLHPTGGDGKCQRQTRRPGRACEAAVSTERRHDLLGQELQFTQDVPVGHAREEQSAYHMGHAVLLHKWLERPDDLVGTPDEEAVLLQRVKVRRNGGVDEGVLPAAGVLHSVGDHDLPLGQL